MWARRTAAAVIALVAVAGAVALWVLVGLGITMGECGDTRPPSDTPQGDLCDRLLHGDLQWLDGLASLVQLALLGFGFFLLIRWVGGKTGLPVALVPLVAALLIPLVYFALATAPSDECPPDKQLAYDRWLESGRAGPQPFNCFPSSGVSGN